MASSPGVVFVASRGKLSHKTMRAVASRRDSLANPVPPTMRPQASKARTSPPRGDVGATARHQRPHTHGKSQWILYEKILSGNDVCYTIFLLLLVKIMLCRKLHCQKVLNIRSNLAVGREERRERRGVGESKPLTYRLL